MDLLSILRQIAREQSSIRLMNIYKGLPISYDTNIASVGAAEVQIPCSKNHIACLYHQGESYLMGESIPVVIRAKVLRLSLAKDYAVLSDFESAQDNIGKRMQIRVEPGDPIMASIEFKGSSFEFVAPLADLSANGASVFFESTMFPGRLSKPGSELTMSIPLPDSMTHKVKKLVAQKTTGELRKTLPPPQGNHVVVNAHGKVVAITPDLEFNRYRVSVQLAFKDLSRMVILQYISMRQSEIIQDLHLFTEDLYKHKGDMR
jgi:hypothetical protein